jgi:outer membrane protein
MIRSACALSGLMGAFLAVTGPVFAQTALEESGRLKLSEALAAAYQTNPQLAEARSAVQALDQGVDQANAGWRPSVNASITQGYDHGLVSLLPGAGTSVINSQPTIGQVTLSQPIFRGGRTDAEVSQAIERVHAGRAQLISTEQSVLLGAVTAYMDVVRDMRNLEFSRQNVRSLQDELNAVRTELSAGAVTRTDAYQAEARLARARVDEAGAESRLAASRAAFESVVGRPVGTLDPDISLPHLPVNKEGALEIALKQNPDLDQARANERAATYAVNDAIGALLPEISVSGQYQYLLNAPNASIFGIGGPQQVLGVTAQVNVPIYQGGAEEATVRRAKDVHEQANMALASAERGVRQNLESAWESLTAAEAVITANDAQAVATQNAVGGVKQEQEAGERSVLDVLNAQQELFLAQVQLSTAQHDQVVAAYRLLAVTGQLTARAQALNVTVYDPEVHYNDNASAWFGFDK